METEAVLAAIRIEMPEKEMAKLEKPQAAILCRRHYSKTTPPLARHSRPCVVG
jgi:hypothetical protein